MPITLQASNLSFAYGPCPGVLQGVSAAFEPGSVTAVLGPNGAGKSTLLRLLAGLLDPAQGQVTLAGKPVARMPEGERAGRIAYIPQRSEVAFAYTARQVVAFGRHALGAAPGAVDRAMDSAGVAPLAHRPYAELSVGQQQRVTLARALAQLDGPPGPARALLADEPLAAMDPRHAADAAALLRRVASSGLIVVLVLHDMTAAPRIADRGLLLDQQGRVAAHGPIAHATDPATLERVFGLPFRLVRDGEGSALIPAR